MIEDVKTDVNGDDIATSSYRVFELLGSYLALHELENEDLKKEK